MTAILFLLPVFLLTMITALTLMISGEILQLYRRIGEPVFIHVAVIFFLLFITFLSGTVGVLLDLDQITHPIFSFILIVLSMTYVITGFIYRSLSQGSVGLDYCLVLLYIAPGYAFAALLGLDFEIIPATISQIIPLGIAAMLEYRLSRRAGEAAIIFRGDDLQLIQQLRRVFDMGKWIHLAGVLIMFGFLGLYLGGEIGQAEQVWGGEWQPFDYLYFVLLVIVAILFALIYRNLRGVRGALLRANTSLIMNSIIK